MMKFEGFSCTDIGTVGNRGAMYNIAKRNRENLNEISDSFLKNYPDNTYDCIVISAIKNE